MNHKSIRISNEESLGNMLYNMMQGDIVEKVIEAAKIEKIENEWKYIMDGYSFKVNKNLSPDVYDLFYGIKERLEFDEDIDFYITNDSSINAFAISRPEKDQPHIINVNSGLIERLDNDELSFVVGHEIGHLITKNTDILKLIQFVFPSAENTPMIVRHKISLWKKLSELTADRFGFLASPDFDKCLSGFFKISAGLDTKRFNFNPGKYLEEIENTLDSFKKDKGFTLHTHPINPIRVKAIDLFRSSALFNQVINKEAITPDEELEDKMGVLIEVLYGLSSSQLDYYRQYFVASAGLMVASIDGTIENDEIEKILMTLQEFTIFPKYLLEQIANSGNYQKMFLDSAQGAMQINPQERYPMFSFMLDIAIADHKLNVKEIEFFYRMGRELFGFDDKEIAQLIAGKVKSSFIPDIF